MTKLRFCYSQKTDKEQWKAVLGAYYEKLCRVWTDGSPVYSDEVIATVFAKAHTAYPHYFPTAGELELLAATEKKNAEPNPVLSLPEHYGDREEGMRRLREIVAGLCEFPAVKGDGTGKPVKRGESK
jgi:hypothetical protein